MSIIFWFLFIFYKLTRFLKFSWGMEQDNFTLPSFKLLKTNWYSCCSYLTKKVHYHHHHHPKYTIRYRNKGWFFSKDVKILSNLLRQQKKWDTWSSFTEENSLFLWKNLELGKYKKRHRPQIFFFFNYCFLPKERKTKSLLCHERKQR